MGAQAHESTQWELVEAAKLNASVSLSADAGNHGEGCDDAEAVEMERIAEVLIAEGAERKFAVRAARRVYESQSKRDAVLAEGMGAEMRGEGNGQTLASAESMRHVLVKIVQAPSPRFSTGCLMLAMGMEHNSVTSARQWAQLQGKSHTQAANEVEGWSRELKLPPTANRKTEEQKKTYRDTNGRQRRETK
jgi:hypothetical protein